VAFEQAIQLRPYETDPYYQIGLTLLHAGERKLSPTTQEPFSEAKRYLQKALHLGHRPSSVVLNALGTVCFRAGEYHEALEWFDRCAESLAHEGGWIPSTFFLAAETCEILGQLVDAIKWYERYKLHGFRDDEDEINRRIQNLRCLEEGTRSEP
jgi:tetratricopeptide (TPR) repeat protein